MKISLYSDPSCPFCHRTRLAISEKNIVVDIKNSTEQHWPEEVAIANPYGRSPALMDRDLILFDANIIINYLDERFMHPPLMPTDPASRAKSRMMLHRIDQDWFSLWDALTGTNKRKVNTARKTIQEDLTVMSSLFSDSTFFLSNTFSVLDCSLAPLLWRLPMLSIKLPAKAKAIEHYAERIFARDSFQNSLSDKERAMR